MKGMLQVLLQDGEMGTGGLKTSHILQYQAQAPPPQGPMQRNEDDQPSQNITFLKMFFTTESIQFNPITVYKLLYTNPTLTLFQFLLIT